MPSRTEHLRLVWPEWQGAGSSSVRALAPEFPFDIARRGYTVGTKVLQAVLPEHAGPTAFVPVDLDDAGAGGTRRRGSQDRRAPPARRSPVDHPRARPGPHHHPWR